MAIYVVTGGAGFIGSNLTRRLVADGAQVRVVDDLSTGRRDNLADLVGQVELLEGSILDSDLLTTALRGADAVFHVAAIPSVQASVDDPVAVHRVNASGTLNVLVVASQSGVRRVVYSSSCAVYGNAPGLPKREDMAPSPESPYAVAKLAGEHYAVAFTKVYGMETVSLRYFNVYGPGQDPQGGYAAVIPAFIQAITSGRRPRVFGGGEQTRDFVFVDDVVQANVLAADASAASGGVFNVGSGQAHSLNDLLRALSKVVGNRIEADHVGARRGDVTHSCPDISRARETLGYEPRVGLEEGLRRTLGWFQAKEAATRFVPTGDE